MRELVGSSSWSAALAVRVGIVLLAACAGCTSPAADLREEGLELEAQGQLLEAADRYRRMYALTPQVPYRELSTDALGSTHETDLARVIELVPECGETGELVELRRRAQEGEPRAMMLLASRLDPISHYSGRGHHRGTRADPVEAATWYRRAAGSRSCWAEWGVRRLTTLLQSFPDLYQPGPDDELLAIPEQIRAALEGLGGEAADEARAELERLGLVAAIDLIQALNAEDVGPRAYAVLLAITGETYPPDPSPDGPWYDWLGRQP
jgi:hypothetical protein